MKILLATIQSHRLIAGDIARGIAIHSKGGITVTQKEDGDYIAIVPHDNNKNETRKITLRISRDGRDIDYNHCYCTRRYKQHPLCRHVIAALLEIQGGFPESPLVLGKTADETTFVDLSNVAETVGSGSLQVFSTPSMVALMEKAACKCLASGLESGQTSVGTKLDIEHIAASLIGATITAEAKIERIFGNKIEFSVVAYGNEKKIGIGTHTRFIVDEDRFMERAKRKL